MSNRASFRHFWLLRVNNKDLFASESAAKLRALANPCDGDLLEFGRVTARTEAVARIMFRRPDIAKVKVKYVKP